MRFGPCVAMLGQSVLLVIGLACVAVMLFPPLSGNYDPCDEFERNQQLEDDRVTFSSKTGYSFKAPVSDESTLNGCTVTKLYAVLRHGVREPGKSHIKDFDKVFDKVSKLRPQDGALISKLQSWKNPFSLETESQLSQTGMKEQYCLAKRFKTRFPSLFDKPYSQLTYNFRSTYKERCIQSALSFGQGLFEERGPLHGYQPIGLKVDSKTNDTLLRFFDDCKDYRLVSADNKTLSAYINQYLSTESVIRVLGEIQEQLDPNHVTWNITTAEVLVMYRICAMETAKFRNSIWCSLFSETALNVLEYYFDLSSYWIKGYGNSLNWRIACPLLNEMIDSLKDSPSKGKVFLRFAHAETLIPLVSSLGLYKDKHRLLSDNFDVQKMKRKFRVSDISPFSGNLEFILYQCPIANDIKGSSYFVRILSNERPVNLSHPLCSWEGEASEGDFCPLNELAEIMNNITHNLISYPCSLQQFCGN